MITKTDAAERELNTAIRLFFENRDSPSSYALAIASREVTDGLIQIIRLVGAILLEQNDEWAVQRARYMTLETIGSLSDDPIVKLPAVAA